MDIYCAHFLACLNNLREIDKIYGIVDQISKRHYKWNDMLIVGTQKNSKYVFGVLQFKLKIIIMNWSRHQSNSDSYMVYSDYINLFDIKHCHE